MKASTNVKLAALIMDVSNTSHQCGTYNFDFDTEGSYDELYRKAEVAEANLIKFITDNFTENL